MQRRRRAVADLSLLQCMLLSILLHVLLVLTFGTVERGAGGRAGGDEGQALDVTLVSRVPDAGYRARIIPRVESGSSVPVSTSGSTGATARPQRLPRRDALPVAAPSAEPLPSLDRGAPDVVDRAIEPSVTIPLPRESPPESVPRVEVEAPRIAEPAPVPAPPVAAPRETAPLVVPPAAAVVLPPPPIEAPVVVTPRIEREAPPVVEPEVKPAPPPAPVETTPVVAPPVAAPAASPPPSAPAAPRPEPAQPRAIEAPPTAAPAAAQPRAAPPSAAPAAAPRAPAESPRAREIEVPRPSMAPPREVPSTEPLPKLKFGAPEEDPDDIFKPRAAPPIGVVPPPGQAPRYNLEAAKKAGPEIGRSDGRKGIFNLNPPPPDPESKLGRAIQKAAQPDCRDAYAAMGLLAVPFLLKDTITDTGCRW